MRTLLDPACQSRLDAVAGSVIAQPQLIRIKRGDRTLNSSKSDLIRLFGLPPSYATGPETGAEETTTMKLTTLAGALLAVLVITGSAAALPGAAVAQADDHADNAQAAEHESDQAADQSENESATADEAADRRGPPASLPEQVPDFVGDIHSLVNQKLAGDLTGGLGEQISDLTPDDDRDAAAENADTESESGQ